MNKGTYAFDQFEHYPHAFQPVLDNTTSVPFFPKDPFDLVQEGSFVKVVKESLSMRIKLIRLPKYIKIILRFP